MSSPNEAAAKACCADLYQSRWAQLILGDSLHPGGLALTNRLGKLMGLKTDYWVADLASARGSSAMAVSRAFHCNVVGVEFGRAAAVEAQAAVLQAPASTRSFFVQGDAESLPLKASCFDAVFCECSMSIFMDKAEAVNEARRLLRPAGRFGLSDVTLEPGYLPNELKGTVGQLLCVADALSVDGYIRLLRQGNMALLHQENASGEIIKLLDGLESKLGAFMAWQTLSGSSSPELTMLKDAPELLAKLRTLVEAGKLGYWLFVAEKSG